MSDPPRLPMEVIAQIIPHLERSTRKATGRAAVSEKFHQKDLATMMRVSKTVQELTAKHLYGEVVVNQISGLIMGFDRFPSRKAGKASVCSLPDNPHPETKESSSRILTKSELLELVTTLHFAYSKEGKKYVRETVQSGILVAAKPDGPLRAVFDEQQEFLAAVQAISCHNILPSELFPTLHKLTFGTWQLRSDPTPEDLLEGSEGNGMTLATILQDRFLQAEERKCPLEAVEGMFGGVGQLLQATKVCRIHCEGPSSFRLHKPYGVNRIKTNVVHQWDFVGLPYLVYGADNHVVIHRLPNAHIRNLIIASTFALLLTVTSLKWKDMAGDDEVDETSLSVHIRQHHPDGSVVSESPSSQQEIIDAVRGILIADITEQGWLGRFHVLLADPSLRCEACGKSYDSSPTSDAS